MLAAAASTMRRDLYDPVREIYNSVLPWNGTPAPPMEEWGLKNSICNHLFCRYGGEHLAAFWWKQHHRIGGFKFGRYRKMAIVRCPSAHTWSAANIQVDRSEQWQVTENRLCCTLHCHSAHRCEAFNVTDDQQQFRV